MTDLKESGALQATKVSGTRYRARLIEGDRWGSSGYYPREVLERDGPNVWPENTQIYLDHPTEREDWERPERSVRDLAGKITSTPVYESDGLYADVEFYPHTAPVLEAIWGDVGMSIRAAGTTESGERDGRTGPIITSLSEGVSVDVVTKAGAGGKLVALLESARGENRPPEPPGPSGTESSPTHPKEDAMEISEADHKALTDKAGRVEKLETDLAEAIAKIDAYEAEKAHTKRVADVTAVVEEAFENLAYPVIKNSLIERLAATDADDEHVMKEAKTVADELKANTAGAGHVHGLGESAPTPNGDLNESGTGAPKRTTEDIIAALEGAA